MTSASLYEFKIKNWYQILWRCTIYKVTHERKKKWSTKKLVKCFKCLETYIGWLWCFLYLHYSSLYHEFCICHFDITRVLSIIKWWYSSICNQSIHFQTKDLKKRGNCSWKGFCTCRLWLFVPYIFVGTVLLFWLKKWSSCNASVCFSNLGSAQRRVP